MGRVRRGVRCCAVARLLSKVLTLAALPEFFRIKRTLAQFNEEAACPVPTGSPWFHPCMIWAQKSFQTQPKDFLFSLSTFI
jgi:hypothetical protein